VVRIGHRIRQNWDKKQLIDFIEKFIDILIHVDRYIVQFIDQFGIWTYLVIFIVIFAETGLVVAPFFRVIRSCLRPGRLLPSATSMLSAFSCCSVWLLFWATLVITGSAIKSAPRFLRRRKAAF